MPKTLFYFHDPMCSWCWAFRPIWQIIKQQLPEDMRVRNVLGGLAADTDEPMPKALQQTIQGHWQRIQHEVPRIDFNYDFWTKCKPRRATYPACRAVIAARQQGGHFEEAMILAIQQAYYLYARNPSDEAVLNDLAAELELNVERFIADLSSAEVDAQLMREVGLTQQYLVTPSFPSLLLDDCGEKSLLPLSYTQAEVTLSALSI